MRVVGYALILLGVLFVAASLFGIHLTLHIGALEIFAIIIILAGVALLMKSVTFRVLFLLLVAFGLVVLTLAGLSMVSMVQISPTGSSHTVTFNGTLNFNFFAGKVTVELPNSSSNLYINGLVGKITILVPKNVRVNFNGSVGLGDIKGLEYVESGNIPSNVYVRLGVGEVIFKRV